MTNETRLKIMARLEERLHAQQSKEDARRDLVASGIYNKNGSLKAAYGGKGK